MIPVISGPGVLLTLGHKYEPRVIVGVGAETDLTKISVQYAGGEVQEFDLAKPAFHDSVAATMEFESSGTRYRIRGFRETDGAWLSKYKTLLPVQALKGLTPKTGEDEIVERYENLTAYASDTSTYITGVVYTNDLGTWVRQDNDWVLLAPSDDSFEGAEVYQISPDSADEFLELYDRNYVTTTDAAKYE